MYFLTNPSFLQLFIHYISFEKKKSDRFYIQRHYLKMERLPHTYLGFEYNQFKV